MQSDVFDLGLRKVIRYFDFFCVEHHHVPQFPPISETDVYPLVTHS